MTSNNTVLCGHYLHKRSNVALELLGRKLYQFLQCSARPNAYEVNWNKIHSINISAGSELKLELGLNSVYEVLEIIMGNSNSLKHISWKTRKNSNSNILSSISRKYISSFFFYENRLWQKELCYSFPKKCLKYWIIVDRFLFLFCLVRCTAISACSLLIFGAGWLNKTKTRKYSK
jgi:hypothetical protein